MIPWQLAPSSYQPSRAAKTPAGRFALSANPSIPFETTPSGAFAQIALKPSEPYRVTAEWQPCVEWPLTFPGGCGLPGAEQTHKPATDDRERVDEVLFPPPASKERLDSGGGSVEP
jgi:hypothetical protein